MDKEKLKELLENPELKEIMNEYVYNCIGVSINEFIEQKRKELEEPTYKTEDGYEVKGEDFVFQIDLQSQSKKIYKSRYSPILKTKQFELKENAENYLIENAEVLSYNDIMELRKEYALVSEAISREDFLKQKIRQKLGL